MISLQIARSSELSHTDFFEMKRLKTVIVAAAIGFLDAAASHAAGPRPDDLGAADLDIGEPGIAWYTTWETAKAEAARSHRPIMFVAAATQCRGVSGVF